MSYIIAPSRRKGGAQSRATPEDRNQTDPMASVRRKENDEGRKMLTKLNIIYLGLIGILCAGLILHAASAGADIGPVAVSLPFTTS